jgi:hypothetical protein
MEVWGLDSEETFDEEGARVEEAGSLFCPLLGAMITSGAHLLLALLDAVAERRGAEAVYMDTDSAFVTPSRLPPKIARTFDSLNPYSLPCPFLKDETPEHSGTVSFFGLSSKRYALFEKVRHGRIRVLKGSDHGLGLYQAPTNREEFTHRVWETTVSAFEHGDIEAACAAYSYLPATSQFALTTPALWPRVSRVEGMRPFNFLTIQYLDPASLPATERENTETLRLLPFISPRDPGWLQLASYPAARRWAHILDAFARHRDRKYLLGPDGRIARRSVLVKKSSLVGLGKEGGRYAARLKLGPIAGGTPSVFIDWKQWLTAATPSEAKRIGRPRASIRVLQHRLRNGTLKDNGAAVRRLKLALLGAGP